MTRIDSGAASMLEDALRVVHVGVVHGNTGRMPGSRPGGEQHDVGLEHDPLTSHFLDLHTPTREEARTASDPLDAVAHQVPLHGLGHELRDLEFASHEQAPRVLRARRPHADRALAEPPEVDGSFAQGFGRNPGRAYRDPARPGTRIDDGDALSEVRGLGRSLLAGRAGAEHD